MRPAACGTIAAGLPNPARLACLGEAMLNLLHPSRSAAPLCDGLHRRQFLQIGSLALGGLTLSQLLSAEALAGSTNSHKSVIMVYLVGGPPHQDMWDLKPDAPSEIAGPMRPTKTNVPGME